MIINLNGENREVETDKLSHEDILKLIYGEDVNTDTIISMVYFDSEQGRGGIILPGRIIALNNGIRIKAISTNNA